MNSLNTEQLPHVTSGVKRILLNADGKADGMILDNGVVVCFPAYLSAAVQATIQSGDRVTIYGSLPQPLGRARRDDRIHTAALIAAAVIETERGERIVDSGPEAQYLMLEPSAALE